MLAVTVLINPTINVPSLMPPAECQHVALQAGNHEGNAMVVGLHVIHGVT